jgi:hypothetical protein
MLLLGSGLAAIACRRARRAAKRIHRAASIDPAEAIRAE